jgi:hypothetical protein
VAFGKYDPPCTLGVDMGGNQVACAMAAVPVHSLKGKVGAAGA